MLAAPEPLGAHPVLERCDSGIATLDEWLRRRAAANQTSGASRTYVVCDAIEVVGYYAPASHAVAAGAAIRLVHALSEEAKAFYLRLGL